jgi:LysR family nitrogen assimilation transcriptional regulator
MELRRLRSFLQVAELRSLTRASALLGVSQPALSRQIRLLETELGARLLDRHGRGVRLTEAGRVAALHGARVLKEVDELRSAVAAATRRPGLDGRVSIGLSAAVSSFLADPFLDRCRSLYPGISLRLAEGFSTFLHEWLLSGSIDLAIMYGAAPSAAVEGFPLLVEDLFAIGADTPENRAWRALSPSELSRLPLIMPHAPHVIRDLVEEAGVEPEALVEIDSRAVMIELAHAGRGYALLPVSAAVRDIAAGRVVAIPIARPSVSWTVSLCHSKLRPLSPATAAVSRLLRGEVAELVRSGRWPARLPPTIPGQARL